MTSRWFALLCAFLVAATALLTGSVFVGEPLPPAWADDDGDDDGDDDNGDDDADDDDARGGRGRGRGRHQEENRQLFAILGELFASEQGDGEPAPRALLVVDPSSADLERLRARGFRVRDLQTLLGLDLGIVRLLPPPGMSLERAERELRRLTPGRAVDRDARYRLQGIGCSSESCWPQRLVGWRTTPASCPSARIGMIDTAVDVAHPGLAGLHIRTRAFAGGSPPELRAHGTAVAGLLAGTRFPGLLPGAELLVADVFGPAAGTPETGAFEIALALDWLSRNDAAVVNLALAGPPNAVLAAAVRRARDRGMLLVAAAGNGGPEAPPAYPAAYSEGVAVIAVDRHLRVYPRANRGLHIALAAPGVDLPVPAPGGGIATVSGTSYAAAFVTAALARELARTRRPDGLVADPLARARDLGPPGRDPDYGYGLLSAPRGCGGTARGGRRNRRNRFARRRR